MLYKHCIKYTKAHIYHYNSYEVNALRRLSQKYNTCELELDELLRGERFIDLYTIVRKLLITSEKGLSLKDLEVFFLKKELKQSPMRHQVLLCMTFLPRL